ncbi:MAG: VanW family protein [Acidimicrobiia bacterium]|nr:VanW family protein [Acidimicrobiia bacterium]
MSSKNRLLIAAVPAALLLLWLLAFGVDRLVTSGEVARGVTAAGIDLSGLGEADAKAAVKAYESRLLQPAEFIVKDTRFELDPRNVGVGIDEDAIVATAMEQGRDTGFFGSWFGWFGSFGAEYEVAVPIAVDEAQIDDVLNVWQDAAIDAPAFEGDIIIRDGRALPEYPRPGEGIDKSAAVPAVASVLVSTERSPLEIGTKLIEPELTKADLDAAVEQANSLITGTVTLVATDPELEIVFEAAQLAAAYEAEVVTNSDPTIEQGFNRDRIAQLLATHRAEIEEPPRDAEFVIEEDDTVTLVPGRARTVLDVDLVIEALEAAALTEDGIGEFPFAYSTEPNFTTADAEAMGPITLEGEFTTNHPAGQARVINIQLMADAVDGAIVQPGDEFSLNEHVGQRTRDKGYVAAPMILAGELVDDVGGGVSQFATTFYNASFYGCYEDVEHKPHSYYFSRYPEVNEATISWPTPHLIIRNNTEALLIIKTEYTRSSITVKFFGNNGGKTCDRDLGKRYAYTDPPEQYEPNAEVEPGTERVVQNGWQGFSNTVRRIITHPDGTVEEEGPWTWRYSPGPKIIEVHPCDMPESEEECPILVPSVVGQTQANAVATLEALGFVVAIGSPVETGDEALDGLVASQSTTEWLPAGSTVTINVYTYVPPDD